MLRHLKMELRRQQAAGSTLNLMDQQQVAGTTRPIQSVNQHLEQANINNDRAIIQPQKSCTKIDSLLNKPNQQLAQPIVTLNHQVKGQPRVRGRRSSKPAMEKKRRARINQCLDILKSYVLTDATNLNNLGVDTNASENQDEETIARTILKTSGLIHRHKGRKNPNKLEKADILELTVNYVRHLHQQRDHLIQQRQLVGSPINHSQSGGPFNLEALSSPLSIRLPALGQACQATPPSPPPSSASSSPQPLLSISANAKQVTTIDVLDLSDGSRRPKFGQTMIQMEIGNHISLPIHSSSCLHQLN